MEQRHAHAGRRGQRRVRSRARRELARAPLPTAPLAYCHQELAMAQPDYRYATTEIGVQFDPHGIRAWLSCVLDDGKTLLLATDRVTLREMCREIQEKLNR
jgi:hypothetical protein